MSLWADYIKEREGTYTLEYPEQGFATYTFSGTECYIRDLYVSPVARKQGTATALANEISDIAKLRDCKTLTGTVCVGAKGDTASMKIFLQYGMKLHSVSGNMLVLSKDL